MRCRAPSTRSRRTRWQGPSPSDRQRALSQSGTRVRGIRSRASSGTPITSSPCSCPQTGSTSFRAAQTRRSGFGPSRNSAACTPLSITMIAYGACTPIIRSLTFSTVVIGRGMCAKSIGAGWMRSGMASASFSVGMRRLNISSSSSSSSKSIQKIQWQSQTTMGQPPSTRLRQPGRNAINSSRIQAFTKLSQHMTPTSSLPAIPPR